MQELPADSMGAAFIPPPNSDVGKGSPADPGNLYQVHWHPVPVLVPALGFQVIAKANHPKTGLLKTQKRWNKMGPLELRILRGPSEHCCCVPSTNTTGCRGGALDTLPLRSLLYPIIGRLFILLGLGLPGTGYRVDRKPEISLGRELGLPFRIWMRQSW